MVLQEGDLLFLNQNAVQEILPAGKDDIAVNFIVLPEFFDTAFFMMGEEENMIWTIFYDSPNKRSCNQITMGLLFLQLLDCMDKAETGGSRFDTEITGAVLSYINEHYKNGSLSELAAELNYDVYWLSREIRRRTGKTYKELLMEKRMQQARYLLENSQIPVTDIIESVGYDNTSYFYRKFRERYGVSPKEYRKNTRGS